MSYLVLARKYRPQSFLDIVGQEHVTRTLQNSLKTGKVAHSFLFSGPRGVGKTTIARLLAKALNCREKTNPEPCNKCSSCQEIAAGNSVDVIEIDGASNRGIDEIRTLRENIQFRPAASRYKIYIIDEVHMLTTEAFNALLKTLEEPPSHGIFIFATTEPQKVPNTILSRCQRFPFRLLLVDAIKQSLKGIVEKENILIEEEALDLISKSAQGSLRDALGFLDQIIAFSQGKITGKLLQEMLGLLSEELLFQLSEDLRHNRTKELLAMVGQIIQSGYDPFQITDRIRDYFRCLLLLKMDFSDQQNINFTPWIIEKMKEQLSDFTAGKLLQTVELLTQTLGEMRWSETPRVVLETKLVRLTMPTITIAELISRLEDLEKDNHLPAAQAVEEKKQTYQTAAAPLIPKDTPPAAKPASQDFQQNWERFLEAVNRQKASLQAFLGEGKIQQFEDNGLQIVFCRQLHYSMVEKNRLWLEDLWEKTFSQKIKIKLSHDPGLKSKKEAEKEESSSDPAVAKIMEIFHGKINH